MWNTNHNYSKEELEIIKELEKDLFNHNPGYRAMWHDNFEAYFAGTLDEKLWNQRVAERKSELGELERKRMTTDFRYVQFQKEFAEIQENTFSGFYSDDEEFEKYYNSRKKREDTDELYQLSKAWSMDLSEKALTAYEKTKSLPLFRIFKNASQISGKWQHIFAVEEKEEYEDYGEMRQVWSTYNLILTFVNRCIESLNDLKDQKLENFELDKVLNTGFKVKEGLIDRLEFIQQQVGRDIFLFD